MPGKRPSNQKAAWMAVEITVDANDPLVPVVVLLASWHQRCAVRRRPAIAGQWAGEALSRLGKSYRARQADPGSEPLSPCRPDRPGDRRPHQTTRQRRDETSEPGGRRDGDGERPPKDGTLASIRDAVDPGRGCRSRGVGARNAGERPPVSSPCHVRQAVAGGDGGPKLVVCKQVIKVP